MASMYRNLDYRGDDMYTSLDEAVYKVENKFGVYGIESEGQGLCYLHDDEKEKIGIMSFINGNITYVILKKNQVKALINELQDIYDMFLN